MPYLPVRVLAYEAQLLARSDAASSSSSSNSKDTGSGTTDQPAPPALSPTAIVGLAIIGAVFATILLAALLRLCMSPTPQESNPSSLYRPNDSNVSQLSRLKEVREISRRAAWEKACTVEAAEEKEIEAAMEREKRRRSAMSGYYGLSNNASLGSGSGSGSGSGLGLGTGQMRVAGANGIAGVTRHHRARMSPGTERAQRDREWRARMGVSAMEARGEVEVEENWDLAVATAERERGVLRGANTYGYGYDSVVYDDDRESGVGVAGAGDGGVAAKGKEPQLNGDGSGSGAIEAGREGEVEEDAGAKRYTYPMVAPMRREV